MTPIDKIGLVIAIENLILHRDNIKERIDDDHFLCIDREWEDGWLYIMDYERHSYYLGNLRDYLDDLDLKYGINDENIDEDFCHDKFFDITDIIEKRINLDIKERELENDIIFIHQDYEYTEEC